MEFSDNPFKVAMLSGEKFAVTWEQVPGRATDTKQLDAMLAEVKKAAGGEIVQAVSITDSPSGNPALPPEVLATRIRDMGIEPLVHIALRDRNRNQVENLLYGLSIEGIRNILVISGDYPSTTGFKGRAAPVFDIDPAHVMQMISELNAGLDFKLPGGRVQKLKTNFFAGVGASPFKKLESEVMGQYFKLEKKISMGAGFIISQIGYDARKMHELVLWLKYMELNVPVMANLYVLSYPAAKAMNKNRIPGAVVTDKLLDEITQEREAEDKGKKASLERAAKMYAMAKGMGYAGVHVGGHNLHYEDVVQISETGEKLLTDWKEITKEFDYPQQGGYYFFDKDELTGLNREEETGLVGRGSAPLIYRFDRILHGAFFEPSHPFFKLYQRLATWADRSKFRREIFGKISHLGKVVLFNCSECGDCSLFDTAYLCPISECPKERRVGPCGGSYEGWCEVYPNEKKCIWVRAYDRLQTFNEEESLREYVVPPRDWDLWQTPSQLNYYLGRDHTAKRLGLKKPE